ncbi:hypothetical protein [Massilia yuzhufengensis]|uniref:Uncharacterized protein n=1 Tax=Massilia yuzhufengensis TaxID=1164594 RepID=A0A1I1SDU1_9BURK|nr:hypothetical protein [Massilia yuzhufengensis]SFD44492.1 hypothetical protein SAMN05216204_12547 [Massilia yuzhufengensis]
MRDKKDNATIDLPGFEPVETPAPVVEQRRAASRPRRVSLRQEQLDLLGRLEETDTSGLPAWRRDDNLDLTGLPVWAPASA